jgi:glycosyltransferase involved in cell wall biosynthesis
MDTVDTGNRGMSFMKGNGTNNCNTGPTLYYILETDISEDKGPGVNEWEFVSSIKKLFPDNFIVFAPLPSRTGRRVHQEVHYVTGHRGMHPLFYFLFLAHQFWAVLTTAIRRPPAAIVVFVKTLGLGSLLVLRERLFPLGRYILYPLAFVVRWFVLQRAQLIDVVSRGFVEWYHGRFRLDEEKFVVVPNGVNQNIFCPIPKLQARRSLGLTRFGKLVGFVGGITEECGTFELANAARFIREKYDDVGFIIVGDGLAKKELKDLVAEYNLSNHFVFTGAVPYEKVPEYDSAFDLGVALFPTWWMQRNGSSSQKIRQYLACGCPVVASRGDGHEFIEENSLGWLVVPEEPEQVAEAICAGLSLTIEEKKIIGKRGREYVVANLSMESLARRRHEMWINALGDRE